VTSDARTPLASRILERAEAVGVALPPGLAVRLSTYYELLFRWNRTINLTALTDSPAAIDRLLLEPVAATPYLPVGCRLLDIGSGGGSPAIPLALSIHSTCLLMVESRGRKSAFLREALRELAISGDVFEGRLDALDPGVHRPFHLVSARAVQLSVADFERIASLLVSSGVVALFRGPSSPEPQLGPSIFARIASHRLPVSAGTTLDLIQCSTWNKESLD
jgi:16S rRNA (guanine527-N7)-methyltransferase